MALLVLGANCPKCGIGRMRGPTYCKGSLAGGCAGGDHLHYVCSRCGYQSTEPTRDREAREKRARTLADLT